jgi:hypothetical protein
MIAASNFNGSLLAGVWAANVNATTANDNPLLIILIIAPLGSDLKVILRLHQFPSVAHPYPSWTEAAIASPTFALGRIFRREAVCFPRPICQGLHYILS